MKEKTLLRGKAETWEQLVTRLFKKNFGVTLRKDIAEAAAISAPMVSRILNTPQDVGPEAILKFASKLKDPIDSVELYRYWEAITLNKEQALRKPARGEAALKLAGGHMVRQHLEAAKWVLEEALAEETNESLRLEMLEHLYTVCHQMLLFREAAQYILRIEEIASANSDNFRLAKAQIKRFRLLKSVGETNVATLRKYLDKADQLIRSADNDKGTPDDVLFVKLLLLREKISYSARVAYTDPQKHRDSMNILLEDATRLLSACSKHHHRAALFFSRARLYLSLGQFEQAEYDLKKGRELSKNQMHQVQHAELIQVQLLHAQGQHVKALELEAELTKANAKYEDFYHWCELERVAVEILFGI